MQSESCVFIAGEDDALIEDIEVRDLHLTQRQQGTQAPGLFDEQPSARGVYEHEMPVVYVRGARNVLAEGEFRRDEAYAGLLKTVVEPGAAATVSLRELA